LSKESSSEVTKLVSRIITRDEAEKYLGDH
jgi:hypothetical protein